MPSSLTHSAVETAIKAWVDPHLGKDLVSTKMLKKIDIEGNTAHITIQLGYPADSFHQELRENLVECIRKSTCAEEVLFEIRTGIVAHTAQKNLKPLPGVKNILAVASGKGGVGKSTVAVNIAIALATEGARVGILDADIYGPSQPMMLGLEGPPEVKEGNRLVPKTRYGIQVMSIGFLVSEEQPMIWRGPMVTGALQQLLKETDWDNLDYLIIDLPPGTGDIQLTLAQQIPVCGALIVTTPQDIALLDAQRALHMFEKVDIPVLGIIENMSVYKCPHCGHTESIFGVGGGEKMASKYGVDLLGALPLDRKIREYTDSGFPLVVADAEGASTQVYKKIARSVSARLALRPKNYGAKFPTITVE